MSAVKTGREKWSPGRTAIMVVAILPFLYPFLYLVSTSIKPLRTFSTNPTSLSFHPSAANYKDAWQRANLGPALLHSLIAVAIAVVLTVAISLAGAFWFLRHQGRLSTLLRGVLIATMAVPPPVFVIPLFVLLAAIHVINSLIVLGLVYSAWNASFGLYLMYAYFARGIPLEVFEAAEVDGASVWGQFRYIVVPLSRSAIATLATLTFVWSWGDLLLSVVLVQDPAMRTLMPSAALLADQFNTDVPANAAATVIALLPMLIVFLFGQRFLQRGILAGVGR